MTERYFWIGIGAIALGAATFGFGWFEGYAVADARGQQRLDAKTREYAIEKDREATAARAELLAEVARGSRLAREQADLRVQLARAKEIAKQRIAHVTTVYLPTPESTPVPLPSCVFTAGFLHDLNAAFGAGDSQPTSAAGGTGRASAAAAAADADLRESGLSQADLLAWGIDTGAQCRAWAGQINKLIDLWEPQ